MSNQCPGCLKIIEIISKDSEKPPIAFDLNSQETSLVIHKCKELKRLRRWLNKISKDNIPTIESEEIYFDFSQYIKDFDGE